MHRLTGNYLVAQQYYDKTLKLEEEVLPPNHSLLAMNYYNVATILEGLYQYEEAVTRISQEVTIISHSIEPNYSQAEKCQEYLNELLAISSDENCIGK
ncbi:unnamed protein product [Rotaria sp. Silwood2]|nr:unnamed protein product [Rotaria sp. Silwood2]CAF4029422.1 unnamed protein product [Rotaria sp. Silwood2]